MIMIRDLFNLRFSWKLWKLAVSSIARKYSISHNFPPNQPKTWPSVDYSYNMLFYYVLILSMILRHVAIPAVTLMCLTLTVCGNSGASLPICSDGGVSPPISSDSRSSPPISSKEWATGKCLWNRPFVPWASCKNSLISRWVK